MHVENASGEGPTRSQIRTLIVEDYALMMDLMQVLFEACEHIDVVGTAQDGWEAITQIETLKPDLVVMDVDMPRIDGLRATPILKKKHPGVRVILLDLYDDDTGKDRALAAGADAYCDKLNLQDQLLDLIDGLFPPS